MPEIVAVHIPLVNKDGFITEAWFRFFGNLAPASYGGVNLVLHGNPNGPPTWRAVDLAADVTGTVTVPNGGTGLAAGTSGGILAFTGANTLASSGLLANHCVVIGGGVGSTPRSIGVGSSGQTLHGVSGGDPVWNVLNLASEVFGTLPVGNGGTGVTLATGGGTRFVLQNSPLIQTPLLASPTIDGVLAWNVFVPSTALNIDGADRNTVSVTAAATTIVGSDTPMAFICHDKTSGGMTLGVMDSTGGVVTPAAFSGIAGIAFTRSAGVGLQAAVTAGVNPRNLSTISIATGAN